ncbi:unnamed protein product [Trichobilharzia regenti]|nr:unnamed protein product [Trichobilharzia regenti]
MVTDDAAAQENNMNLTKPSGEDTSSEQITENAITRSNSTVSTNTLNADDRDSVISKLVTSFLFHEKSFKKKKPTSLSTHYQHCSFHV